MSDDEPQMLGMAGTMAGDRAAHVQDAGRGRARSGPSGPTASLRTLLAMHRWGPTPAAGFAAGRHPLPGRRPRSSTSSGTITFDEVAPAHATRSPTRWRTTACCEGDSVGGHVPQPPRLHRDGVARCPSWARRACYLNTAFAGPQLTEVVQAREARRDHLRRGVLRPARGRRPAPQALRRLARRRSTAADPTLDELIAAGRLRADPCRPTEPGRTVILTSGTTGTPKGASRKQPETLEPAAALLSRIPLRRARTCAASSPRCSTRGASRTSRSGCCCGSTYVLQRKFDPEDTLPPLAQHQLQPRSPMVPVMVQRIMELPEETRRKYDLSSLKCVPLSGLGAAGRAGQHASWTSSGTSSTTSTARPRWPGRRSPRPRDLRAAPGTAGRPPRGTVVKIYDEDGHELPQRRGRPHLRRQRDAVRGLHGRRLEGHASTG